MPRKTLSREEIAETVEVWRKYNHSKSKAAKELGIGRVALRHRLKRAKELGLLSERDIKIEKEIISHNYFPSDPTKKIDRDSIRTIKAAELVDQERLDHAKIVRSALSKLNADECVYDDVLRRDLNISVDRWKEVRDLEEFFPNQVILPNKKRVWCHSSAREYLLRLDGVRGVGYG